jgi:acetate kinase
MSESSARTILTINAGSSSIKFAVFEAGSLRRTLLGEISGIGRTRPALVVKRSGGGPAERVEITGTDHSHAAEELLKWLSAASLLSGVAAIGHRIVHGGEHLVEHRRITTEVVAELKEKQPLDPAHLPQEIALIEMLAGRLPDVPQMACFDTAFHRGLPRVAQLLPIPRRYIESGIRRLGFHGLSYTYLLDELRRVAGDAAANGRVILAHLGSGASLAAVHHGKPVDTTMAFTPTAGLVMSTRPGDIDPGLLVHLMRIEGRSPKEMDEFINEQCGLLGVSGTTGDMRELLARRGKESDAAEAVALFCYQARKWIGAFAAALGGLDTLVFSGGIGERSAVIRREICQELEFLNFVIDEKLNERNASTISVEGSAVTVRVMATDEEIVIARAVAAMLEER